MLCVITAGTVNYLIFCQMCNTIWLNTEIGYWLSFVRQAKKDLNNLTTEFLTRSTKTMRFGSSDQEDLECYGFMMKEN